MTDLVACLSYGKGTWGHVIDLINTHEFDNVYLIVNDYAAENFSGPDFVSTHTVDRDDDIETMRDTIIEFLEEDIEGTQVALNLYSGSGKEHMAMLSACLKLGLGIRLIASDDDDMKEV